MKRVEAALHNITETVSLICGGLLILSAIYVSAELLARTFLNIALLGSNEISGYVVAIATSWAFSYALMKRSHIRIDVFYRYLPPRWLYAIDVVAAASLAGFAAIFVWYATHYFNGVWTRNTRSITSLAAPLWIPVLAWYLGWIMFLLCSIYVTAVSASAYVRGDFKSVIRTAGSITQHEEVELEIDPDALPDSNTAASARI